MGRCPEKAIPQSCTVARKKKDGDWATWIPYSLNSLSLEHEDQKVRAVEYNCSEAFVQMTVSIKKMVSKIPDQD